MKWQIRYMVDPGDGIVTTVEFEHESDDIIEALVDWNNENNPYGYQWIVSCELA